MATGYLRAPARTAVGRPDPVEAIDDLIKFRLVESMLRQPDQAATAPELASRLGFHSADVTAMALDELVSAGVLRVSRRDGVLRYALKSDSGLRGQVAELIAAGPPTLLNRLAAASVARVKKLLRKRR